MLSLDAAAILCAYVLFILLYLSVMYVLWLFGAYSFYELIVIVIFPAKLIEKLFTRIVFM